MPASARRSDPAVAVLKRVLRLLFYSVLLLLALVIAVALVFTFTERGRDNLASLISDLASSEGQTVRIGGLDGLWSGHLTAEHIVLEDAEGPWLVARDVAVDWSPLRLVTANSFDAKRVAARRVEVARLPASPPQQQDTSSSGLPVSLDIDRIELPEVALGAELAGGVAQVAAEGSLTAFAGALDIATDLTVRRTDGQGGELAADIRFAPGRDVLDLSVQGSEPQGGIIANLLALPGAPSVAVDVSGQGSLDNWQGTGTFSVDGSVVTRVAGTIAEEGARRRVTLTGSGQFARFLPASLRPLAEGEVAIDLDALLDGTDDIEVERATLTSAAVRANASGTLDTAGASDFSVALRIVDGPVALALPLGADTLDFSVNSLTGRVFGDGAAPMLDVTASLARLAAQGNEFSDVALTLHSDGFDLSTQTGPLALSVNAASATPAQEALRPLAAGQVELDLTGNLSAEALQIEAARLRTAAATAELSGVVSRIDSTLALTLAADVDATALPPAAQPPLGPRMQLSGGVARDAAGMLSVSDLVLNSGPLAVQGTLRLADGTLDTTIGGTYADVAQLADGVAGAIAFSAELDGPLLMPTATVAVTSERLAAAGYEMTDVELTASGALDMANPGADISLKGVVAGETVTAAGRVATSDGRTVVETVTATLGENRATGSLVFNPENFPEGTIEFQLPELARLAALAGETVSGTASGRAVFSVEGGVPRIALDATLPTLQRGDMSGTNLQLDASVGDYFGTPQVSGRLRAGTLNASGATIADLDVALDPDGEWIGFDGNASVNRIPVAAAGRARVAGGDVTVELASLRTTLEGIEARLAAPSTIAVVDGQVRLDGLSLSAAGGTIAVSGTAGETLALDVALSSLPAAIIGSFVPSVEASGTLSGTARIAGTAAAPTVSATITAAGEGVTVAIADAAGGKTEVVLSGAELTATKSGDTLALDLSAALPRLTAQGTTLRDVAARVRSDSFDLSTLGGPLALSVTAQSAASANATLEPLLAGPLEANATATLSADAIAIQNGSVSTAAADATVSGSISRLNPELTLDLKADVAASALPAAARGPLGERVAVTGQVKRNAEGVLAVSGLEIVSGPLTAQGTATVDAETLEATLTGAYQEVARLAEEAAGIVAFSLNARGPIVAPQVALEVTSDSIRAAGREITDLALNASGTVDLDNPAGEVSLTGKVGGEALSGSATLSTTEGVSRVQDLLLSLGENRISGALTLDDAFVPEGRVDIAVPQIGPLAALAGETVQGSVDGSIDFRRRNGVPEMAVDATIPSLTRGDLSARDVSVDATIRDYLGNATVSGRIQAASVTTGGTTVASVDVTLTRDGAWTGFDGKATVNAIPVEAAGRALMENGDVTVELASGSAALQGVTATLARPTTIAVKGGEVTLDDLALNAAGGSVTVSGTAGQSLALDAQISGLPASALNAFSAGLGASGTISGRARISGSASDPQVGFTVDWQNARTAQTAGAGFGAMDITSSGTYGPNGLDFTANVGDGSGLGLKGGGAVSLGGRTALNLDFSGSVPFSFLAARLAAQGLSLSGAANVSLRVSGPALAPTVTGSVTTTGARLVDTGTGIAINDIAAEVALASGSATVRRLTGSLSTGGTVTASGTVGIDPAGSFPADLSIRLDQARYTDGRVVTTTLDGALTLTGPLTASPTLGGSVNLGKTVITIPERLKGALSTLEVQHKNAPADVVRQQEALRPATASGGSGGLILDVTVNAPQQIFVRGRGLDAELGGTLRLAGSTASPQATGQFTLRRGRLSLLGRRLDFTSGTIGFAGSLVPYLDLTATSSAGDAAVTVTVTGPATDPEFAFSSVPTLPEDEVLARLVFGRSMSNLSPLQIAQLAEAAAQIAGVSGPSSLLENLREQTGIDDLDVTTDAEGNAAVSVGKYLNDRTYVTIEKGEKSGSGKATINLDVGKGLKLRGEAGESGQAKGGIYYEREY
jgi:translocation and assembly module TamB